MESYLWIYGAGEDWWWSSDNSITLALDRDTYAPGETATVLIQSRVAGTGLLTVQRDTVISEQVVTLTGPVTAVELPVTAAMTPNAHLVFHMYQPTGDDAVFRREGKLVTGRTELRAPSTQNFLTVDVSADHAQYRPRDVARLTINLTDYAGQPQAGQVSVAVVDEAIFALAADRSGSILDAFYAPGPDRTSLYDSLIRNPDYFYGYPEVDGETPAPSPTATPGPLEPDASLDATAPDVRRLFLDTAYWNATVAVDASGRATVDVPLPDNLTTWRVVVKAVTGATQVGEAQGQLLVTQALVARPILPRFAVVGDQFSAGVVGQNFTGADVSGAATLAGAGLHLLDGDARALTIPDGGSAIATWNVVAAEVGTAPVQTTVTTPAGGDAVELPLPVKPFAVPARDVMAGQATPRAQEAFTLPLNAVNDATALTVRLTPSLALGVLDGLDELIDYPYGCVEQTMSRVLPTAAAAQVYRELGLDNPKAAELPAIVNEGLQRLYGFQHDDGGWGWFFDDEGSIYTTAYVLFGLTAVQQSGFDVDADVLARGFAALAQRYPEMNHAGMQAFVQYVLAYAGQGDLAAARALLARAGELDAAGLATLALTFDLVGAGDEAQPLVDRLLTLARSTSTTAYWPAVETWDEFHWRMMTSDDKNTALAVAALARLRPDDARLPKAVRWLMEHRRGAGWSNTQATAFAVLGLLDAIKARGELAADYAYRVELNGAPVLTGRVTPENVTTPIAPLVIPGADLAPGANTLAIVREDDAVGAAASDTRPALRQATAPLYYSAVLDQQLYFDAFAPVASAGGGINVTRRYELIEGTPRPDGAYDLGDVVQVTLDIELAEEMYYVMVQDPIPAGFDVISERENLSGWSEFGMPFFWRDWGYNRKEVRDDRVDFFLTQGWAGEHTLTYTMRATLPGTFSVLPTSVFPMYADQFWGRSGSAQVTVAPEQLTPRPALAGDIDHSCTISNFDVQLVAAAWPHAVPGRDVVADGVVDLRDVAAVAARRGAACSADLPLPETAGDTVTLGLAGPDATQVLGDEFVVTVRRAAAGVVDGVALQLAYDPTLLRPVRVQWADGTSILPLGPVVDAAQGRLLFGGYNLEPSGRGASNTGAADDVLADVVFAGIRVGAAEVRITAGQVADDAGRVHNAAGAAVARVRLEGEQTFLPMIQGN
ncbi:MAG: alpha-2-macroglobulin family protein [Caldilineaceae bacterium]